MRDFLDIWFDAFLTTAIRAVLMLAFLVMCLAPILAILFCYVQDLAWYFYILFTMLGLSISITAYAVGQYIYERTE